MSVSEQVQSSLEPMFEKAREDGLWFFSPYQGLWFSPDELVAAQSEWRFRWGAENWRLRNPTERLKMLEDHVLAAQQEVIAFKKRIGL